MLRGNKQRKAKRKEGTVAAALLSMLRAVVGQAHESVQGTGATQQTRLFKGAVLCM